MKPAKRSIVLLAIASVALATVGCGRSPANAPMRLVRVPVGQAPPSCDGDDDDDAAPPPPKPVEYVRIDEWQAPAHVQEFESQVIPRGAAKPSYIQYPKLTLHQPIPETRVSGRLRRYR